MYRVYAARPAGAHQPRHPPPPRAAARQRPAPHRADERPAASRCRARRSSTTATRSAWATTSTSATATACARRCSGARDRNAGFSRANPQRLYLPVDHRPRVPLRGGQRRGAAEQPALAAVVDEAADRAAQALRGVRPRHDRVPAAGEPQGAGVRARATSDERILVVANLSRFAQYVELDLSRVPAAWCRSSCSAGRRVPARSASAVLPDARAARLLLVLARAAGRTGGERLAAAADRARGALAADPSRARAGQRGARARAARAACCGRRWFGAKARRMRSASIADVIRVPDPSATAAAPPIGYLVLVACEFTRGRRRDLRGAARVRRRSSGHTEHALPRARRSRLLHCADGERRAARRAARAAASRGRCSTAIPGAQRAAGHGGRGRRAARPRAAEPARRDRSSRRVLRAEQSNTSLVFGDRLILKLFRRVEEGVEPRPRDRPRFLDRAHGASRTPAARAARSSTARRSGEPRRSRMLQEYVPNEGDAWQFTLDALGRFFEDVLADMRAASRRCRRRLARSSCARRAARAARDRHDRRATSSRARAARPAHRRAARSRSRRDRRPGVRARAVDAAWPSARSTSRCARSARQVFQTAARTRSRELAAGARHCSSARARSLEPLRAGCSTRRWSTCASASTATSTSARCCGRARTS